MGKEKKKKSSSSTSSTSSNDVEKTEAVHDTDGAESGVEVSSAIPQLTLSEAGWCKKCKGDWSSKDCKKNKDKKKNCEKKSSSSNDKKKSKKKDKKKSKKKKKKSSSSNDMGEMEADFNV